MKKSQILIILIILLNPASLYWFNLIYKDIKELAFLLLGSIFCLLSTIRIIPRLSKLPIFIRLVYSTILSFAICDLLLILGHTIFSNSAAGFEHHGLYFIIVTSVLALIVPTLWLSLLCILTLCYFENKRQ